MFDDTIEHEAANPSDQLRVVFIFDVWHPGLGEVEREAVRQVIGTEGGAEGAVSFEATLTSVAARPFDHDALDRLAKEALAEGEEEQAIPLLEQALEKAPTARLWQWKGLLERAIDQHQQALESFA